MNDPTEREPAIIDGVPRQVFEHYGIKPPKRSEPKPIAVARELGFEVDPPEDWSETDGNYVWKVYLNADHYTTDNLRLVYNTDGTFREGWRVGLADNPRTFATEATAIKHIRSAVPR